MIKNHNSNFDRCLTHGEIMEDRLCSIFAEKRIEIKSDNLWHKTGNIAVEYFCWGKKSGISISKAKFWAFILEKEKSIEWVFIVHIKKLRHLAQKYYDKGSVKYGGDAKCSWMILIPVKELIQ